MKIGFRAGSYPPVWVATVGSVLHTSACSSCCIWLPASCFLLLLSKSCSAKHTSSSVCVWLLLPSCLLSREERDWCSLRLRNFSSIPRTYVLSHKWGFLSLLTCIKYNCHRGCFGELLAHILAAQPSAWEGNVVSQKGCSLFSFFFFEEQGISAGPETQMGDPQDPLYTHAICHVQRRRNGRENRVFLTLGSHQLRLSDWIVKWSQGWPLDCFMCSHWFKRFIRFKIMCGLDLQ